MYPSHESKGGKDVIFSADAERTRLRRLLGPGFTAVAPKDSGLIIEDGVRGFPGERPFDIVSSSPFTRQSICRNGFCCSLTGVQDHVVPPPTTLCAGSTLSPRQRCCFVNITTVFEDKFEILELNQSLL